MTVTWEIDGPALPLTGPSGPSVLLTVSTPVASWHWRRRVAALEALSYPVAALRMAVEDGRRLLRDHAEAAAAER